MLERCRELEALAARSGLIWPNRRCSIRRMERPILRLRRDRWDGSARNARIGAAVIAAGHEALVRQQTGRFRGPDRPCTEALESKPGAYREPRPKVESTAQQAVQTCRAAP